MPSPDAYLTTLYCTDEHIAIRSPDDFATLLPGSQVLAYGKDGVFGAGDLWTLTSASNDFQGQGVAPGDVVRLLAPKSAYIGGGVTFAISSVSGTSMTLRQVGCDDGVGQAPSPAGGLTGVEFRVGTFRPQREDCTYQIRQKFGISDINSSNSESAIYDLRVLRRATVCMVLYRAYLSASRKKDSEYAEKLEDMRAEMAEAIDQVRIRWGPSGEEERPSSSSFATRLSR